MRRRHRRVHRFAWTVLAVILPLVILGVFGGLLAFGFIVLFIGPVLLAVAYTLVIEWSHIDKKPVANDVPEAV